MYTEPDFRPTRSEMYEILEKNIPRIKRTETIPLKALNGRVSVRDIFAVHTLPNTPTSSCDGICVHFSAFAGGAPDTSLWKREAEYDFCNTGCALPAGYDTVIAIESVLFDGDEKIAITHCPAELGEKVTLPGSSMKSGETLVFAGEKINPSLVGILASGGIMEAEVYAKPVVSFIPTGDELVPIGTNPLPDGKNIEANGIMLSTYIEEWGGIPQIFPVTIDDPDVLLTMIRSAIAGSDIVLICAGSAKGTKDFTIEVLKETGNMLVQELGHGPGKHCSLFMTKENIPVIGLPGPPNGADLIGSFYVKAAIALSLGLPIPQAYTVRAELTGDLKGAWIDFVSRVRVSRKAGRFFAEPAAVRGKTRAAGYHGSNGFFYIEKEGKRAKGESIDVELTVAPEEIGEA